MSGLLAGDPAVGLFLGRLLLAMGGTIAVRIAFLLLHHAASVRREATRRRRIEAVAEEVAPYLAGRDQATEAVTDAVRRWGRRAVSTVLRRARRLGFVVPGRCQVRAPGYFPSSLTGPRGKATCGGGTGR